MMLGLDTETVDGYCRLLAIEDGRIVRMNTLSDFLGALDGWPSEVFCCYNLDYDVGAILKFLPEKYKSDLYESIPVIWRRWTFRYIPGKKLTIVRRRGHHTSKRFVFFDVLQFFGMSLDKAAKKYLGDQKLDFDRVNPSLKRLRTVEAERYCVHDAVLAGRLMRWVLESMPPSLKDTEPLSPAFLSARYFREELNENRPAKIVNGWFQRAFRGGRFEVFRRGYFSPCYNYDIHSAYPAVMADLPTLSGSRVQYGRGLWTARADFGVYRIEVGMPRMWVSPIQIEGGAGLSVCPVGYLNGVWVTREELFRIAEVSMPHIQYGVEVYCSSRRKPLAVKLSDLYEGKQTVRRYAYKKILNSLYGKLCQTVSIYQRRQRIIEPESVQLSASGDLYSRVIDSSRSNFVWASSVTARVRMQLYDAILREPNHVMSCFTDSIITRKPMKHLDIGDGMGQWGLETFDWMAIIGTGVYFYGRGSDVWAKFRGYPLRNAGELWERIQSVQGSCLRLGAKRRYSYRSARVLDNLTLENLIVDVVRQLDLNFDHKRIWADPIESGKDLMSIGESEPIPFLR